MKYGIIITFILVSTQVNSYLEGAGLKIMANYFVLALFFLLVNGVFGDVVTVSVKEGDSVTLNTGVTKQQPRDKTRWYFEDTLIALINGEASKSCLYDGEGGIFSGRLEVDYENRSLTITDIRSEHTGRYELEMIRSKSTGTSHSLNRNPTCDSRKIISKTSNLGDLIKTFSVIISAVPGSGQSPAAVAGASVPVLFCWCLLQRLLV